MKTIEFFYDYGSPAAYLAWARLPQLVADTGAGLRRQPMLLGGVFQATGNQSPAAVPAKGRYTFTDFSRFAKRFNIAFGHNPHFPINTLTLMRMAAGLQLTAPERLVAFDAAVFDSIWVKGDNLNDAGVAGQMLAAAGFDPAQMMALASDTATKDHLKAATAEAVARGAFGAPTFFVGSDMFWGQDRLDFVAEAAKSN